MVKNLPPIQEIYSEDIFSKLDPMNSNLNKSIIKHEQPFNFSEPKSSNLLDQLCKINIFNTPYILVYFMDILYFVINGFLNYILKYNILVICLNILLIM